MPYPFWGTCLAFALVVCGMQALNPNFDKEGLALQIVMTDWKSDSSMRELISFIGSQIPMEINETCRTALDDWTLALIKKDPNAVKMVDASGKLPSGALLGHILILGEFDECIGLQKPNNATGEMEPAANYCLTRLDHPGLSILPALPAYGVCLPRECSDEYNANGVVTGLFRVMKAAKDLKAVKGVCLSPTPKDTGFKSVLAIILFIGLLIIAAGIVDYIYRRKNTDAVNSVHQEIPANDTSVQIFQSTEHGRVVTIEELKKQPKPKHGYPNLKPFLKPLLCFNLSTNVDSILSSGKEGEISYLHGFRVLSMWWIILGHTYYLSKNIFENQVTFFKDIQTAGFQIVLNAGYAVDSFFLLSGLLVAYVLASELSKHGRFNWALVYFHRWWRLTPVYFFVMLCYVYVLPHGIQGPIKLLIQQEGVPTEYCKSKWWANILYINNLFATPKNQQCMNWTWFLALDMQFFIIAPLLVFLLYKFRAVGFAVIGLLITASVITTMWLIGYYGLPINWGQKELSDASKTGYVKDVDYIYEKPYTRIAPFLVGLAIGYFFVNRSADNLPKSGNGGRLFAVLGWILSCVITTVLLFGFYFSEWSDGERPQSSIMQLRTRILFGGLQRLGWSLVVGWILFACQYGYAKPVRQFLGARFWRPLSNLTYGAYLVHMLTIQLYIASQRHMIFYSPINMATIFLAQIILAYGVAFLVALLVEVPLLRLERLIIRRTL